MIGTTPSNAIYCYFYCLICSDLQGIKTHARQDGSDWILNGSKVFITNGYMADLVIVVAVTDPNAKSKAHGISLFLVDADAPGFKKGRKLDKIGQKAQVCSTISFMTSNEELVIIECHNCIAQCFYFLFIILLLVFYRFW
jgi:alkylation response protein AidB-like acyl-CoA dehydrogenase